MPSAKAINSPEAVAFVRMVARLAKDGECPACLEDGEAESQRCEDHRTWVMENDEAYDMLHSLISEARSLTEQDG